MAQMPRLEGCVRIGVDWWHARKEAKRFRKSLEAVEPTIDTVCQIEMLKAENDYRIDLLERVR